MLELKPIRRILYLSQPETSDDIITLSMKRVMLRLKQELCAVTCLRLSAICVNDVYVQPVINQLVKQIFGSLF